MFHCLHDIPDPERALSIVRQALAADGSLFCVESNAERDPIANRGTNGELFATISPAFNLPVCIAAGGDGTGTIIAPEAVQALGRAAGFEYEEIRIFDPPPSMMHRLHLLRRA